MCFYGDNYPKNESNREDNEIETGDCIAGVVQLEFAGNEGS